MVTAVVPLLEGTVILMLPLQFCSCSLKFLSRPDKKKQMGSLANIDIPSLIQYIGVLQVNCMDPRNYFGHDLVQEAVTRLDEVPNTAPTYGALVMSKLSFKFIYAIVPLNIKAFH